MTLKTKASILLIPGITNSNEYAIMTQNLETGVEVPDPVPSTGWRCCGRGCVWWDARRQVYVSQFLSSWGDRMWMFSGGLFLMQMTPGSLRLAAIYGAALCLTIILAGASVGRWVDLTSRLTAARVSLALQNTMVVICASLMVLITSHHSIITTHSWVMPLAKVLVVVTACLAEIGSLGTKLAIEKDWILIICGKDQSKLSSMNSVLRTVDLSTEVLAPVMVGIVMTQFGLATGGGVIAGWNVVSLGVEYLLLTHIYHTNVDLQEPKEKCDDVHSVEGSGRWEARILLRLRAVAWAWKAYLRHPVRDAGLALAMLYMTVLALDNYSRAFVYESGVSETILGLLTAITSLAGIAGSLAFPVLIRTVGVSRTGLVGFGLETLCLTLCVVSVFTSGSPFNPHAILSTHSKASSANYSNANSSNASKIYNHGLEIFPLNPIDLATSTLKSSGLSITDSVAHGNTSGAVQINQSMKASVIKEDQNFTSDSNNVLQNMNISISDFPDDQMPADVVTVLPEGEVSSKNDFTSVVLLLTGIVSSRFGLWLADLSVTQILQQRVEKDRRGTINGVQSSLNQCLSLLRSILIILIPSRESFGYLIILSFCFVTCGSVLFCVYVVGLATTRSPTEDPSALALVNSGTVPGEDAVVITRETSIRASFII